MPKCNIKTCNNSPDVLEQISLCGYSYTICPECAKKLKEWIGLYLENGIEILDIPQIPTTYWPIYPQPYIITTSDSTGEQIVPGTPVVAGSVVIGNITPAPER